MVFRTFPPKKTIVVYDVRVRMKKLINEYESGKKFDVKEVLQAEETVRKLR